MLPLWMGCIRVFYVPTCCEHWTEFRTICSIQISPTGWLQETGKFGKLRGHLGVHHSGWRGQAISVGARQKCKWAASRQWINRSLCKVSSTTRPSRVHAWPTLFPGLYSLDQRTNLPGLAPSGATNMDVQLIQVGNYEAGTDRWGSARWIGMWHICIFGLQSMMQIISSPSFENMKHVRALLLWLFFGFLTLAEATTKGP
jgi:hypothetical protein